MNIREIDELLQNQDFEQLTRVYKTFFDSFKTSIDELRVYYSLHISTGNFNEADKMLKLYLKNSSYSLVEVYYFLTHLYVLKNEVNEAKTFLSKGFELDSEFMPYYYIKIVIAMLEQTDFDKEMLQYIEKFPKDIKLKCLYCLTTKNKNSSEYSEQLSYIAKIDETLADSIAHESSLDVLPLILSQLLEK